GARSRVGVDVGAGGAQRGGDSNTRMTPPDSGRPAQRAAGRLFRFVARVFYRIERIGAPTPSRSVLFVANHPNGRLDPAVVWATAGRDVRFLAKSTLFRGPLGPLIRAAAAIPVYRKMDAADMSKNAEMFSAVEDALADGDAVCLFPEGTTHSTGR